MQLGKLQEKKGELTPRKSAFHKFNELPKIAAAIGKG